MCARRPVFAIFVALLVVLAGCSGIPGQPSTPATTTEAATTTQPPKSAVSTRTTTPAYGPALALRAVSNDLAVQIEIYNTTFARGTPVFETTYELDAGEQRYLTHRLHGMDAARIALTVNETEVWNTSLDLSAGYTVEVNETEVQVSKTVT